MNSPPPPPHHHLLLLPIFVLFVSATAQDSIGLSKNPIPRRILHQPLFPESSTPPPVLQSPPPPPQDGPFFPEVPGEPSPDQTQPQLSPPSANVAAVPNPIATQPTKPTKKVAIVVSVGIATLGMFSALGFYIYRQRLKLSGDSHKLVGGDNPRQIRDDSGIPPSSFLYTSAAEQASSRNSVGNSNRTNESPYRKLRSDRYRPSPELRPLPPLTKPPLPPTNSPPRSSSSDEEGPETMYYTPHGSTVSNDSFRITDAGTVALHRAESAPSPNSYHLSKRTSPKSRISASSPELKATVYPTIKQTPPPPPPPPPSLPRPSQFHPKKPELSASPPPQNVQKPRIPLPPPPPPPPLSTPRKLGAGSKGVLQQSKSSQDLVKSPPPTNSIPQNNPEIQRTDSNESSSSAERIDGDEEDGLKPRLKPLHWDKVRATSDRATVWDQLKSSSFHLNEDMMESLFGCNSANSAATPKLETRRSVLPPVEKENRVLDPKKSQNIAILLRALNVTRDEVTEALLDGNPEGLGAELLETLAKMAPTKEEEIKLRDYSGDVTKLGTAEKFLKSVLEVPFAFKRVEAMLYRANFDTEVQYLRQSFQTLEAASEELKNSRLFLKLLEAVLRSGNRMNVGTNRGHATSFKLDTLLKLVDIKGTDGKTTLLHFVVQEIVRSEGALSDPTRTSTLAKEQDFRKQGLQIVAGLSKELGDVKKAAGMDSVVLSSYLSKLETGLEKVRAAMEMERSSTQGKFVESMEAFVGVAEDEIARVKAEERKALLSVKDVTQYFHGDAAKEEAHPLRIFLIVRDFLSILDHVCKEVGRMDNVVVGSARSFRIPPAASLPVLDKYNLRRHSSDN